MEIIDENYQTRRARCTRRGLWWKGSWATPIAFTVTQLDRSKTARGTVGGAVIGGVLAGGAGAVVGALAGGNRGKTVFMVRTLEGDELVCRCPAAQFEKIAGLMPTFFERVAHFKALANSGTFVEDGRVSAFLSALLFGPFYFAYRYGVAAFLITIFALIAWPALPFIALIMHNRQRSRWISAHGETLRNLDIDVLRNARRLRFEEEHGLKRA